MTIELTRDIYTQLEALAQQQSITINELLQDMIHEYKEANEDTLEAIQELRDNKGIHFKNFDDFKKIHYARVRSE